MLFLRLTSRKIKKTYKIKLMLPTYRIKPQPCVFLPNLCDAEPTSCFGPQALEDEKEHKFYTAQILKRGTDKEIKFKPS